MGSNNIVSVVIPAYNAKDFIDDAVRSCFVQTCRPLEILVVNDGSTDSTADRVKNLSNLASSSDVDLSVLNVGENRGAANALNLGFSQAKGEHVCWLSADDVFTDREKIDRQIKHMDKKGAFWSYYRDVYRGGSLSSAVPVRSSYLHTLRVLDPLFLSSADLRLMSLLFKNPINGSSIMIRKDCVVKFGQFDPVTRNVDGDGDLWMRYSALNLKLEALKGAPVFLREHTTQTSKRKFSMLRGCELTRLRILHALERKESLTRMIAKFSPFLPVIFQTGYYLERPLVSEFLMNYISARGRQFPPFLSRMIRPYLRRLRKTENYQMIDPDEFSQDLDKFSKSSEFKNFERIYLRR